MSYAPARLLEVRDYLAAKTGLPKSAMGIVGDASHTYGYHLGKDRLPTGDYSAKHPRDKAGLSDAASALDIGNHNGLAKLCAWMVAEARAGRRPDTREIIGPGSDGRAYRWARETDWKAELRAKGDSHEWHIHESYYRDSENADKVKYFRPYYEGDDDVTPDELLKYDPNDDKKGVRNRPWREDAATNATVQPRFALEDTWDHVHRLEVKVDAIAADVVALKDTIGQPVSDEQLERVLRKVLGSVDGTPPQ